ncbi:MAG TPA: 4Fe-4S dicluster-binding protein [Candidatus Hypogeohydataceae bacterium YC41]
MKVILGGLAQPATSLANNTGTWRNFRPVYLQKACIDCKMCTIVCPEGCVYRVSEKKFTFNANYCKGCGMCAEECPVDDIEMIMEEK